MDTPALVAGAAAVLLALVALLAAVLVSLLRSRAESRRQAVASQAETAELRSRLEELSERLETTSAALVETREAYLITDAGDEPVQPVVPDRVVLSATLGEPLVKTVAFGHGVRRAMSAESRNRIWFEMRREVRRARKQRRREMKEAWRRSQTEERAAAGVDVPVAGAGASAA